MLVTIISWRYHDGSSNGVVGVFKYPDQARAVYDILAKFGDTMRVYSLQEFNLV